MRAILFKTVWRCACALTISGGAYGQPGPAAPQADQALPSSPVAAQPAKPKPVQTRSARSSGSAANISAAVPATAPPKPPTNMPVKPDRSPSAATPASGTGSVNPENAGSGPDTTSSFDNLEIVDAGLKGKLAVLRVGSQPSANNLLSVFVGLKNKTSHRLDLEMRTVYKDKAGNELNSGSWIPMTLKPHQETEYRSASISAEAADFMIHIRRAPDAGTGENK